MTTPKYSLCIPVSLLACCLVFSNCSNGQKPVVKQTGSDSAVSRPDKSMQKTDEEWKKILTPDE